MSVDDAGREARGVDGVVAGQGVDGELIGVALGAGDVHDGGESADLSRRRCLPATTMLSLPAGAVDDDAVDRAVADAAAGGRARSRLTVVTPVPVRSLTVTLSAPPRALKLTCSTPLVSMVMLPTSRKRRRRVPLAERSMFSLTLAPLKTIVSKPAWPSTMSLPSPGFQTNVSLPSPMRAMSLPRPPVIRVVAVAADEQVIALAAGDDVVAGAAVDGQAGDAGGQGGGVEGVVAAEQVDGRAIVGSFGAGDVDQRRQAQ